MIEKRAASASAVGGKTARPCDGCLKKRARWYCAADDAFLCQSCDASVHSANSLAQRHERLRLKTASSLNQFYESCTNDAQPAWHGGFQRKARTSRPHPHSKLPKPEPPSLSNPLLVPELGDEPLEENEEQLLYRVPIFDPMLSKFCTPATTALVEGSSPVGTAADEVKPESMPDYAEPAGNVDNLPGFIPSDVDLAEFAADVESLLGRGLEEDTFCMEGLGLLESREAELGWRGGGSSSSGSRVKLEEEEVDGEEAMLCKLETEMDTLELNFDYDTPTTCEEEEGKVHLSSYVDGHVGAEKGFSLRLDYEAVMMAWAGQGLPWTTGDRPQLNPDDCWPDCTGMSGNDLNLYGDMGVGGHVAVVGVDGGREARVLRYREKRRTRLFHKKIRYEVRKLNAEKRPRMKGRFVKRASFASPGFPF